MYRSQAPSFLCVTRRGLSISNVSSEPEAMLTIVKNEGGLDKDEAKRDFYCSEDGVMDLFL